MAFFRILIATAVIATILQFLVVTLGSASLLTLDGNTLRIVAALIGLIAAIVLPAGMGWGLVRTLTQRGRDVKRSRTIVGMMAAVNAAGLGALLWFVPSLGLVMTDGATALASTEIQAPSDTPEAEAPAPKGTAAVEGSQAALLAVLEGSDPKAMSEALTQESAAAVGALWMAFLSETYGDELRRKAGDEAWMAVHTGLPDQPDLWRDPSALETDLTRDGRGFLKRVALLADAAADGVGTGSLVAPVLPEALLQRAALEGTDLVTKARYREVAMNRVEVDLQGSVLDVRYEDRGWRVHLGDYGDLANRRVSPRAMLIALHP